MSEMSGAEKLSKMVSEWGVIINILLIGPFVKCQ